MPNTRVLVATFMCLLFLLAPVSLVVPVAHASSTPTFSPAINLSNDAGVAKQPAVSNNGQNVYVVWDEGGKGVFFRVSADGGSTWTPPATQHALKVSTVKGVASFPVMFTQYQSVLSGDVYFAWAQTVSGILQVFVAASTNNGISFKVTQLSLATSGGPAEIPAIAASGSDVYVAWYQPSGCAVSSTDACIYVSSSTDNGQSWSSPLLANPGGGTGEEQIVASGSNAYLTSDGIYFEATYDNGATWSTPVLLYNDSNFPNCSPFCFGREPWIAADGLNVYVTWEASNPLQTSGTNPDYLDYGRVSNDGGETWNPPLSQAMPTLMTGSTKDVWEPENAAFGTNAITTFHDLGNQGIYMTSTTNAGSSWGSPVLVSPLKLKSSFAHPYTSDGLNDFVMWGQQISSGSSTWNAYVSYSGNSGGSWSAPIDISNNANGVAAGNKDVTLFALSANGVHCFAAWTYTSGTTSQIYFAHS